MNECSYDLIIIGGGPRTVGLLTAAPQLLNWRLAIVEESDEMGPGKLGSYSILSNSRGSDYLRWILDPSVRNAIEADKFVKSIVSKTHLVPLESVGRVFAACGCWIKIISIPIRCLPIGALC